MLTASGSPSLTRTPVVFDVVIWIETGRRSWRRDSSGLCRALSAGQVPVVATEDGPIFQPWAV